MPQFNTSVTTAMCRHVDTVIASILFIIVFTHAGPAPSTGDEWVEGRAERARRGKLVTVITFSAKRRYDVQSKKSGCSSSFTVYLVLSLV